ncbi:MAG: exodeoxyribonuclease V subunit beta [Geobacteraceae bacterium]|nr:exodeoxyribonuclease V subunit beta [Geobacteraceae bacterium]
MKTYDNLSIELAGDNLIEASAGTGKTFAIACLYLRLVVEKGLLPENILVVTFTEAATKELRTRVRERLRSAREFFSGSGEGDDFCSGMNSRENVHWPGTETALLHIDAALRTFDCAAISTIHGFCSRALQENAFESGSLYETELVADQADLVQSVVDDFWRMGFFGAEAPLLPIVLRKGWLPGAMVRFLRGKIGNPELEVVPVFDREDLKRLARELDVTFRELAGMWMEKREEVAGILTGHQGLSRSRGNFHPDLVPALLDGMDRYVAEGIPAGFFKGFEKFTTAFIKKNALKRVEPPAHPFLDLCGELAALADKSFVAMKSVLFEFAGCRLDELKAERSLRFYDDLLTDLWRALDGPSAEILAARLRERYRAALIDEFQDTDPVQYRIFHRVFSAGGTPLFLIGDPKQAIYSFRGADIFAYLAAREHVSTENRFTMDRNWRSTPEMIGAVNLLFEKCKELPFVFPAIGFPPVAAAREERPLALEGRDPAALQVWFLGREEGNAKVMSLNAALPRIVRLLAAEVSGLLADGRSGKALLDGRGVLPEDIAVIVRSHDQASLVKEAFSQRGIPAVVQTTASIFATREAGEMCRLLAAVVEPSRETAVRSALATAIFGVSGNEIATLLEDENAWEERLASFQDYHELWLKRGFMTMFRFLLSREGVRERMLGLQDGERRLTNILHCGEVLHQAAVNDVPGMDALRAWFGERVSVPPEDEEYQLRLESDEKAVRIVTIHVSKGLEYPIVFCPFSWGGVFETEDAVICHEGYRMVADLGSAGFEEHRTAARAEILAENLRLLYVALTRARCRCYLVWGRFRHTQTSAPAYILHYPPDGKRERVVEELSNVMENIPDAEMIDVLKGLRDQGAGCLQFTVNPEPREGNYQDAWKVPHLPDFAGFRGSIETDWRVASFTSFAAGHRETAELPDRDQEAVGGKEGAGRVVEETLPAEGSIFAFPRGARAGICLHAVFENIRFSAGGNGMEELVAGQLHRHGFGEEWQVPVSAMVRNVVRTPLGIDGDGFCLGDLAQGEWMSELEFFFPLRFMDAKKLSQVVRAWDGKSASGVLPSLADRLEFSPVRGMVRGFIDMVFRHQGRYYLVDWKSNHLGNRLEDYQRDSMSREMELKLYRLQYLLYTVALNRFLAARDPAFSYDAHFGGVLYLFLRGMDPDRSGNGIYFDLPPKEMIGELTACLVDFEGVR